MENSLERIVHEDCVELKVGTQIMFVSPEMERAIMSHPRIIEEELKLEKVQDLAKEYYAKHLELSVHTREICWNQAAPEYRQCFLDLARIEIEEEEEQVEVFNGE